MYSWIWRNIPGSLSVKIASVAVIILAVMAVLLFVIFPWIEPRLPFSNVTVDQ